ncbi:hypothetical protein IAR55_003951 [Kwoniella newhampshirensis]|uniref:Telomere length regulation protein conserved domain-containing protein n=1 Tax=Kwoniella newhampshirensis TaxID=1651941 RepID=A0AAW0YXT8_9TREE
MTSSTPSEALKSLRAILRTPNLSPDDLSFHLSSALISLHIHPTSVPSSTTSASDSDSDLKSIGRYLPSVQTQILTDVVPTFLAIGALDQSTETSLRSLFVQPKTVEALSTRRAIALTSYLTLPTFLNNSASSVKDFGQTSLPTQSRSFILTILEQLTTEYGIDDLYYSVFTASTESNKGEGWRTLQWEDVVRSCVGIPAKAGNAVGRWRSEGSQEGLPAGLVPKIYFERLVTRFEGLMFELSQRSPPADITPLQLVLEKLAAIGDESAAKAFLETVFEAWSDPKYIKFTLYAQQLNLTHVLILALSLIRPFSPWLISLSHRGRLILAFQSYLSHPEPSIRRLGMFVAEILSELTIEESATEPPQFQPQEEIEALKKGLEVDEERGEGVYENKQGKGGRVKRLKFSGLWEGVGEGREECRWLRRVVGTLDSAAIINDSWEGWLLGWDVHPNTPVESHQTRPTPTLVDPRIARGRPAQTKRHAAKEPKPRTKPKIVMLDPDQLDDPLGGYDSDSPSSSRSPSPTPSYLEEVAADPSLALDAAEKRKLSRPVYIPQLAALLKEREKPEHIEMGLKWGEGLVRAKREFGTELAEYSVSVTLMALGLNDPFNIERFDEKRQGLMNALVACSPREVALFLCEQYFNNQYSLQQKSVILTALAMGARELAGMSVPQPPTTNRSIDFPSKTLPASLHRKYISAADVPQGLIENRQKGQIDEAIDGVRNLLLSKGARKGEETVPEIAREKRLRVSATRRTLVAEEGTLTAQQMLDSKLTSTSQRPVVPFKDIAAEYFIMPLINRFWQHFQDSSTRESRASSTGTRYRGAGTGMILSPLALEKFLMTLSLLLHAARHSSVFLAVLCPEALELAVTIGARHPTRTDDDPLASEQNGSDAGGAEASTVGAALELCLVALDGSFDLDGGRTLAFEKAALLLGVGEWATNVFKLEEIGGQVAGGQGGKREGRIKAGAAGVVLKVGEIGEKWGHLGLRF